MSVSPLVSVLMTAYNRQQFIAEAIESVLTQTYTNLELIIVDDCSSDNSVVIANEYAAKDKRIRVIINEKNLGDYGNRNRAASFANGVYLMYVDSDDTINPDSLEYIVRNFQFFPNVQHSTICYDKNYQSPCVLNSEESIRKHFYENNMLATGPGARVFTKIFFKQVGGYTEKYGPANDMYFNIKSTSQESILLLPYVYINYRLHNMQENKNIYSYLYNGYLYFKDVFHENNVPLTRIEIDLLLKKNRRRFLLNLTKYFLKTYNIKKVVLAIKITRFSFSDIRIAIFH
jgi:glycosyltransferase involved in cell wall biosynthesis